MSEWLRCPRCGRFYSDSGIPRDFVSWRDAALALHCDIYNCDALSTTQIIANIDALSIYTREVYL
jgi:hypothetical protein